MTLAQAMAELKRQVEGRDCSCRLNPLAGLSVPCDTCLERDALVSLVSLVGATPEEVVAVRDIVEDRARQLGICSGCGGEHPVEPAARFH